MQLAISRNCHVFHSLCKTTIGSSSFFLWCLVAKGLAIDCRWEYCSLFMSFLVPVYWDRCWFICFDKSLMWCPGQRLRLEEQAWKKKTLLNLPIFPRNELHISGQVVGQPSSRLSIIQWIVALCAPEIWHIVTQIDHLWLQSGTQWMPTALCHLGFPQRTDAWVHAKRCHKVQVLKQYCLYALFLRAFLWFIT